MPAAISSSALSARARRATLEWARRLYAEPVLVPLLTTGASFVIIALKVLTFLKPPLFNTPSFGCRHFTFRFNIHTMVALSYRIWFDTSTVILILKFVLLMRFSCLSAHVSSGMHCGYSVGWQFAAQELEDSETNKSHMPSLGLERPRFLLCPSARATEALLT